MEEIYGSPGAEPQQVAGGLPPIDVRDEAGLIRELNPQNAGRTILVRPGTYKVGIPLTGPDRATLQGAGEMLLMPWVSQTSSTRKTRTTTITASSGGSGFKGNLVTLGNQSRIRKLIENAQTAIDSSPEQRMNLLEGANQFGLDDAGRGGNVVAVASRDTNDIVSATIEQCELINKITSAVGPETDGPTGGAILAYTRNPKRGAPPTPHQGATVTVTVTQSIIDTPNDGKAVFAMNFASRGTVIVNLTKNKIGGPLDIIGGLSRPDAVANATTKINSVGNHYSPQGVSTAEAWQIIGGSSSPVGGTRRRTRILPVSSQQTTSFKSPGRQITNAATRRQRTIECVLAAEARAAVQQDG